jgi:hypothetical protein
LGAVGKTIGGLTVEAKLAIGSFWGSIDINIIKGLDKKAQ